MTEQQPYDVVEARDGFELRRYPEHVVAEVAVSGTFEAAGNQAFRLLFAYISGRNRPGEKVAMTAPVVQEPAAPSRIAMTAPVVQSGEADGGRHVVAFVMPAGSTEESLPAPEDPRVVLRTVPEELAAARRFTGRWSQRGYEAKAAELLSAVADADLDVVGPLRFARFDPPWTPWFLRRNEVVAPVVRRARR